MGYPSWYQNCKKSIKKELDLSALDTEHTHHKKLAKRSNVTGGDGKESTEGKEVKWWKTGANGVESGQD